MTSKVVKLLLVLMVFGTSEASNDTRTRIFGGDYAQGINYYEVAIVSDNDGTDCKVCTGAILNQKWVLTSAYCAQRKASLRVQVGSAIIDVTGNIGQLVYRKHIHPYYSPGLLMHDIALLEMNPVLTGSIKQVLLPKTLQENYVGSVGTVSGWGAIGSYLEYSGYLFVKKTNIIDNQYCQQAGNYMAPYKLCSEGRVICENGAIQPRIVGENTNIGARSILYEVAILSKDDKGAIKLCTGSIIHALWIITSASCASRSSNLRVQFANKIEANKWEGAIVEKQIIHPSYVPTSMNDDIALLKLLDGDSVTGDILKIAPTADKFIGRMGLVSGFGLDKDGNNIGILREKASGIQSSAFCNKVGVPINANQFCTYPTLTCEGDQGSPIVIDSKLVGLVTMTDSFASLCGISFTATYNYIAPYRPWIITSTGISGI